MRTLLYLATVCILGFAQDKQERYINFNSTSILTLENITITYENPIVVNFYDQNFARITAFKWFKNRIYINDCKDISLATSSPLYVRPSYDDDERNATSTETDISLYKDYNRLLVIANKTTLLIVDNVEMCGSILKTDVSRISFNIANSFNVQSVVCDPGYYLNTTLHCNKCPNDTYSSDGNTRCTKCPDSYVSPEGSPSLKDCIMVNYKGYYHFNEETSLLHVKILSRPRYSYTKINLKFYDVNRTEIAYFQWYSNEVRLGNCKTIRRERSSSYNTYDEYGNYNDDTMVFNLIFYKSETRFLVTESEGIFFNITRDSECSESCNRFFTKKTRYIGFSNEQGIENFYTEDISCKTGHYLNSTLGCNKCPANTYSTSRDMDCTPCPAVSTSPAGSGSIYDCKLISCEAGRFLLIDGSCKLCPSGSYSTEGQITCTTCPDGTTSSPGSTTIRECKGCAQGSVFNDLRRVCEPCPRGTYSSSSNSTTCYPCFPGQTSDPGSLYYEDCYWRCQPGEIIRGDDCLKCPPNTYSPGNGATQCRECPRGYTSPAGSTARKHCKKK